SLESLLKKQCTDLSGVVAQDAYQQVASFFNANLAGLFPFADPQVLESADPEMIREFYDMMDAYGVNIKSTLAQANGLGDKGKRALEFITKMENIRDLFGAYLDPSSGVNTPSFAFTVDFR